MSDVSGGYASAQGIDILAAIEYVKRNPKRVLDGLPGLSKITNAELLAMDVDVLVPAALEGQITSANAHEIRASSSALVILERPGRPSRTRFGFRFTCSIAAGISIPCADA